ncbi:MAG: hypothetical protein B7W95_00050 [Acidimicrobiales bacterium 20-64-4]|nr:MAG: hypothetical protein B7W95_00050 [Acidimicrobiales bacterium 20-64-4]
MAERLISSSRAGTVRTDVAVGTARDASILATMRAAAPRRGVAVSSISTSGVVGAGALNGLATFGTAERW